MKIMLLKRYDNLLNMVKNIDSHLTLPSDSFMEYYLQQDGQQCGPYDEATIRFMLAANQILPTDLIWNEQMPNWATIESIFPAHVTTPIAVPMAATTPVVPISTSAATASVPAAAAPAEKPEAVGKPDKKEVGRKSNPIKMVGLAVAGLAIIGVILWFFVFRPKPEAPRSKDEIMREIATLPALFLTENTQRQVTAPEDPQNFVDKETGEICWRARACHNPDCPGKGSDGKPHLFISPNPAVFLEPDGTFGFDLEKAGKAGNVPTMGACPECLKKRNLSAESKATKNKYTDWVKPYTLPESQKRKKELLKEHDDAAN